MVSHVGLSFKYSFKWSCQYFREVAVPGHHGSIVFGLNGCYHRESWVICMGKMGSFFFTFLKATTLGTALALSIAESINNSKYPLSKRLSLSS